MDIMYYVDNTKNNLSQQIQVENIPPNFAKLIARLVSLPVMRWGAKTGKRKGGSNRLFNTPFPDFSELKK